VRKCDSVEPFGPYRRYGVGFEKVVDSRVDMTTLGREKSSELNWERKNLALSF
jgi:hypothetical protein